MGDFYVKIGGVTPEEKESKNQSKLINQENFNNCKHREGPLDYEIKTCCKGIITQNGYICQKLDIKNLSQLICSRCNFFERKEELNKNE